MGNSQVAFDAVCCDDHRRRRRRRSITSGSPSEHGFGTTDLAKIKITGDVTLDEAQGAREGLQGRPDPRREVLRGHATSPRTPARRPSRRHGDYCWGGCPGAIEEAIEILRVFDKETDKKMPRMHVVFGAYEGAIDAKPGEKVVFIGDCADVEGRDQRQADRDRERLQGPLDARSAHREARGHLRQAGVGAQGKLAGDVIRLEGCPVSVAEQVLALVTIGRAEEPVLRSREHGDVRAARYLGWKARVALNKLQRKRYQQNGTFRERGQAAPELTGGAS